jgi:hypothetical protein
LFSDYDVLLLGLSLRVRQSSGKNNEALYSLLEKKPSRLAAGGQSDPESFGEANVIHQKKSEAKVLLRS